ncbi:MAG: carboxyl transferase domain-containing protein, partial [Bradymonadaceae bacterium]
VRKDGELRIPGLERVFFDAATVMREARLAARKATLPRWNRIILVTNTPVTLERSVLEEFARRLAPQMLDLALDRIVIESMGADDDTQIVEFPSPVGLGSFVVVRAGKPSGPGPLTKFEEGVISAHHRGLFYAYEVIDWLVSGRDKTIPRGRFEEYDIDEAGAFVRVAGRPYGMNEANLVVGVIRHVTPRFPDGLERVIIVGDATRTMGSLGEEECRRIEGAIDLAAARGVPVEWVPISSGARIALDSGTENLDWTAKVVRKIVEFTQAGGAIHIIVDGPCVGAQSYWNAEATMLMHCKGALIMTPRGYMILTGRRALEYSGSVAAETNQALGGLEIMVPNGEAQYVAADLFSAYQLLFKHYDLTYGKTGQGLARTADPLERNIADFPLPEGGFEKLGEVFDDGTNPGRKKPFPIRAVMEAVLDADGPRLERWEGLEGGESAVTWLGQLGGHPVTLIGIESRPIRRRGSRPVDGPETWMSGTLFPNSSRKIARALNAASGVHPVVVLANLSGFDGSPESLRHRQLEWGAEIARGAVNFDGPIIFCVIARYHGGAFVVFSQALNENLQASALKGTYASVIGGAPAAAVVFPSLVDKRTRQDERVLAAAESSPDEIAAVHARVRAEIQGDVAREFDEIHSIERARSMGSLDHILSPGELRHFLGDQITRWITGRQSDKK